MATRDRPVIEVTPAMILAGAHAVQEWWNGSYGYDAAALWVLRAMLAVEGYEIVEKGLKIETPSTHVLQGEDIATPLAPIFTSVYDDGPGIG